MVLKLADLIDARGSKSHSKKPTTESSLSKKMQVMKKSARAIVRPSSNRTLINSLPSKLHPNQTPNPEILFTESKKLGKSSAAHIYDSELKATRRDLVMADDVQFENMVAVDDGEALVFYYHCRCRDYFFTDSFELE